MSSTTTGGLRLVADDAIKRHSAPGIGLESFLCSERPDRCRNPQCHTQHFLKSPFDSCVRITAPKSSNTRMFAGCERERDRYFAYATALRTASGPPYQIGPYRNRSLIRSTPSPLLRGRTS